MSNVLVAMDCMMSTMTSQALEDHLWMLSLKIPIWRSWMCQPFEISTMSTECPMKHFFVGIVLSFVFSDIRRNTMIRGMGDSL